MLVRQYKFGERKSLDHSSALKSSGQRVKLWNLQMILSSSLWYYLDKLLATMLRPKLLGEGNNRSGFGQELGEWGLDKYMTMTQVTKYCSDEPWGWYQPPSKL